ncbi:ATP-binding protein [Endozoicomonas lisbonensis]|uniref:AAA+ superfamily predicted ATPase n=1 Tax=Endozoicomonas lisbonensis TaxID=3120522 RepID=A0ABV2SDA0_9GAMM
MNRPADPEYDSRLLEEMAALARLVDGAWHLACSTNESDDREMDEQTWVTLRDEALASLGQSPVMEQLKTRFHLNNWELALAGLCALPQLDPRYQKVFADLNPAGQPVACLELLLNLLCPAPHRKRQWLRDLLDDSSLFRWRLLRFADDNVSEAYVLTTPLWLSPDLLMRLMGSDACDLASADECLTRLAVVEHPCPPVTDQRPPSSAALVQLQGETGSGRRTFAQTVAEGRPVFQLDGERLMQHSDYTRVLVDCLCHISLHGGELLWPGGMTLLREKTALSALLVEWLGITGSRCWLVEAEESSWPPALAPLLPVTIRFDRPDREHCAALWQAMAGYYLSDNYLSDSDPADPSLWATVAEHYQLLPGTMLQVVLSLQARTDDQPLTTSVVFRECLNQTPATLSGLATRVTPVYGLDDVIVNDDTHRHLQEIIHRYQQRENLYKQKLCATRGLLALFWGKPGTGKTMVAEALSDALNLPLYKANLASISSKWIGETEKHLAALFDDAERHNGLLFFDEADAVFSRRSQVESSHDKNANLGVSYLLQRMEHFHGLLVLATNFKGNLDPAFMRRMHFSVEFTQPDADDRLSIWRHWLGKVQADSDLDEAWLATQLELSGAQIRNIVQHSASQAIGTGTGMISRDILARAIYRESQKNDNSFLMSTRLASWHDLKLSGDPADRQMNDQESWHE